MIHRSAWAACAVAACLSAAAAAAQERRDVGAHVHGEAELTAAADDGRLVVELRSPLANIVGFEHAPRDDAERAALDAAMAALESGDALVAANAEAGCVFESAEITPPSFESDHDADHAHHADDDHDGDHDADHDEHHDEEHGEHHGEHHAHEGHAEIVVTHAFVCSDIAALTSLAAPVLDAFPGIEDIEATFVSDRRQSYRELERGDRFDLDE